MVKSASNNVKTAVNLITVNAYDSLISDLEKLKLDNESYESVLALIESKKDENVLEVKGKKNKTRVGHGVPAERQCKHEANGKKCKSFMSDKSVGLCWVHMSEKQQGVYRIKREKQKDKKKASKVDLD